VASATTAPYAAAPISNLVSRRIEASADVYALPVTDNVPTLILMQHDLVMSNLTRLDSSLWQTIMFPTHPDPAWRIAQASSLSWQSLSWPQGRKHRWVAVTGSAPDGHCWGSAYSASTSDA
jgi:STE24 endopeptidase